MAYEVYIYIYILRVMQTNNLDQSALENQKHLCHFILKIRKTL